MRSDSHHEGANERRKLVDEARGDRLTAAMSANGISHNCQLCYDIGVTESTLSRWRSGGAMSVANAVALAAWLGVSLDWLLIGRASRPGGQHDAGTETVGYFLLLSRRDRETVLSMCRTLRSAVRASHVDAPKIAGRDVLTVREVCHVPV